MIEHIQVGDLGSDEIRTEKFSAVLPRCSICREDAVT